MTSHSPFLRKWVLRSTYIYIDWICKKNKKKRSGTTHFKSQHSVIHEIVLANTADNRSNNFFSILHVFQTQRLGLDFDCQGTLLDTSPSRYILGSPADYAGDDVEYRMNIPHEWTLSPPPVLCSKSKPRRWSRTAILYM